MDPLRIGRGYLGIRGAHLRSTAFAGEGSLKISHLTNKVVENIHKIFDVQVTVHRDKFL